MAASASSRASFLRSTIGRKLVVAVTGVILFGFLAGHLAGNLLMFVGPEAMNAYAELLKTALHGWGVWIARAGLLAAFVLHVSGTLSLYRENRKARGPEPYGCEATVQASRSSRLMVVSGLVILAFVAYHLAHFTANLGNDYDTLRDAEGRHDVYAMVVKGFSFWPASAFYIVALALLCSHLGHGVSSVFQTLGLATDRNWPAIRLFGRAYALVIFVGFISIPICVLIGVIG